MTWFRAGLMVWSALFGGLWLSEGLPTVAAQQASTQAPAAATYVGSAACARCDGQIYERWKQTRMANVVRDRTTIPTRSLRIYPSRIRC